MPQTGKSSWARIMAPLSGGKGDVAVLTAAAELARPFGAEVSGVYAPADVADLMPWMGEGFMGGVQITAVESLKEAASQGEKNARAALAACGCQNCNFVTLESPVWASLAVESRLSDVVVFDDEAARGRGPLAEAFQQLIANEQRPTVVARPGLKADGVVAVAWDGGKEATRAARTSMPLLEKASRVVILGAPSASSREFDPERLR
ncbi:MAG: universal stress protein, partial [Phenylobacterium sp.]